MRITVLPSILSYLIQGAALLTYLAQKNIVPPLYPYFSAERRPGSLVLLSQSRDRTESDYSVLDLNQQLRLAMP
jgi:hypothetical protein